MVTGIKAFIKNVTNSMIKGSALVRGTILSLHHRLQTITEEDIAQLENNYRRNVYQIFYGWVLDVLQFGIVATFVIIALFGWPGFIKSIMWPFAFGMLLWLVQQVKVM